MKYKAPTVDTLLSAIEAEAWAGRRAEIDIADHAFYIHAAIHEVEKRLCRYGQKYLECREGSAIDKVFRKLGYE